MVIALAWLVHEVLAAAEAPAAQSRPRPSRRLVALPATDAGTVLDLVDIGYN
jgi:hypothetical protein